MNTNENHSQMSQEEKERLTKKFREMFKAMNSWYADSNKMNTNA